MSSAYPRTARSNPSGPVMGGYSTFVLKPNDATATETDVYYIPVPFACRVMEVSVMTEVTTQGAANQMQYKLEDGGADGATGLADLIAIRYVPATATVETIAAASLPNRDLDKVDILVATFAAANAGDVMTNCTMTITVWVRGHAVAAAADD